MKSYLCTDFVLSGIIVQLNNINFRVYPIVTYTYKNKSKQPRWPYDSLNWTYLATEPKI